MINLTVVIDNDEAIKKLRELQKVAKTTTSSIVTDAERMDASWQKMKSSLAGVVAGVSFGALTKQVVQVRGEVQQLEVAFETMLGSKEKASKLMSEAIDLAAKTPFGLQDVSNATKMLLAYGSSAEEVTKEIKMLGNIASGLSIPLNDMIYLYGTTRTQGRMFTQDLRQFMGRGIPLAEELAKQFGVTKDKVGELVTAGKVGFDEMAKALQAMTSEGGQFNDLMEKQSKTIAGQISNLEDAIYQMFNEIGKSSEGVISDLISGASWVVEHYQEILNVLKYVIAAYGSYKAAVILVAAAHKAMALAAFAGRLLNVGKAVESLTQAMRVLNVVTKANPIGILASVLMTVATACFTFGKRTEETAKQMGALEKASYDEYIEVNRLVGRLQDANLSENERNSILNKLKTVAPSIVDGLKDEADMTAQLTANLKDYNAEQIKRIQLAALDDKVDEEMKKVADARTAQAQAQLEWSKFISDYQAKKAAGAQPTIDIDSRIKNQGLYVTPRGKQKEAIEKVAMEAIDRILSDVNTTDTYKALRIGEYLNFGGKVDRAEIGLNAIGGTDIGDVISTLNEANENVRKAETSFDAFVKEDKQLREIIGSVADNTKNDAEAVRTYAQAFTEAQDAYLSTQKELAKANADRAAGKSTISEKEYLDIKDRAELAKKEYQKLGGVTSTKEQTEKEKKAKEAAKLAKELQYAADQAVIDAIGEGTEKKIAQIELDYRKRADAIRQQEADLMAKQGGTMTADQQALFGTLNKGNAVTYAADLETAIFGDTDAQAKAAFDKLKADKAAWNEYLIEYGTFQERLKATTIKYNQAIADAKNDAERKTLEAERDALLTSFKVQASEWAKEITDMSTSQLNKMLTELQAQVDAKQAAFDALDNSNSQEAKDYQAEINTLKAKIAQLQAELGMADRKTKDGKWEDAAQIFQGISSNAKEAADAIEGVDEGMASVLRGFADGVSIVGSLVSAINMVTSAATAAQAAMGWLALITIAIQVVSKIIQITKENEEATRRVTEAVDNYTNALRALNEEQERAAHNTIFGDDSFGEMLTNLEIARDRLVQVKELYSKIQENGAKGVTSQAFTTYSKSAAERAQKYYDDIKASDAALVADMRTGWQASIGSTKNIIVQDLADFYDANGMLDLEKLKAWYDQYGEYLSDEQKHLVNQLIEGWQVYYDSVESVNEYLKGIFGDLGVSITDSLVDAFANGTDAAEAMGEAMSNVIAQIARDVAHSAFIAPLLEDAQAQIDALTQKKAAEGMSDEDYIKGLMDIGKGLVDAGMAQQKNVDAFLGAVQEYGDAQGYDVFGGSSSSQTATSKGFQAMSQDTGSELNGRFTDIQGQTHRIAEAVEFCRNLQVQGLAEISSINTTVAMIHNDTSLIASHTKALAAINENISQIRSSIENGVI